LEPRKTSTAAQKFHQLEALTKYLLAQLQFQQELLKMKQRLKFQSQVHLPL
jgi:hypothetical protein